MFHCTCFQTARGKQVKARGQRPSAFICFRLFGMNPVEHEARVFKLLLIQIQLEILCAISGASSERFLFVTFATMELNHVAYLLGYPIVGLVANILHPPTC